MPEAVWLQGRQLHQALSQVRHRWHQFQGPEDQLAAVLVRTSHLPLQLAPIPAMTPSSFSSSSTGCRLLGARPGLVTAKCTCSVCSGVPGGSAAAARWTRSGVCPQCGSSQRAGGWLARGGASAAAVPQGRGCPPEGGGACPDGQQVLPLDTACLQVQGHCAAMLSQPAVRVSIQDPAVSSLHGIPAPHAAQRLQSCARHELRHADDGKWCCRPSAVMVCTDAAARGLDIPDIRQVIQADFASSAVDYLHRVRLW